MATNDDELKFVTANHEEGVNFKSFETSKKKEDLCENSSFALLRQMAQAKNDLVQSSDLSNSTVIRDSNSLRDLITGQDKLKGLDTLSIKDASRPLRNRSSIQAFLSQGQLQEDVHVALSSKDLSFNPLVDNATTGKSPNTKRFGALFKTTSTKKASFKQDSLQDIFKRLLQCQ